MSLSKKILTHREGEGALKLKDAKEFIKKLKKKLCAYVICKDNDKCDKCKVIDKLAGEDLI